MSSRVIEYIWKVARPKDEGIARALMYAAYKTAVATDPNATKVLIRYVSFQNHRRTANISYSRSYIHPTTRTGGVIFKDQTHITISVKNEQTAQSGQYLSSHGYIPYLKSFEVNRVKPSNFIKGDDVNKVWLADMESRPSDTCEGPPALLGPKNQYITWPSEETGE